MDIGNELKKLRKAKRMTQNDLARRVRVTKSSISSYENGTRLPSYDVLVKMARVFHVSTDNLLGLDRKFVVNVTGLTQEEINVVVDVADAYKARNRMKSKLQNSGLIEDFVREDEVYSEQESVDEYVDVYVRRMQRTFGGRYARSEKGGEFLVQPMFGSDEGGYADGRDGGLGQAWCPALEPGCVGADHGCH